MMIDDLMKKISPPLRLADGITISGGEPFEQFTALEALLQTLRPQLKSNADVLVYSGLRFDRNFRLDPGAARTIRVGRDAGWP
jgi:anaerobic ribonucleoside-triphosphate reductase activating protein